MPGRGRSSGGGMAWCAACTRVFRARRAASCTGRPKRNLPPRWRSYSRSTCGARGRDEVVALPSGRGSVLLLVVAYALGAPPANITELMRAFEHPPDDARIMMRWWWFGPAVTKPELEREMRLMKEGGIGGVGMEPGFSLVVGDPQAGVSQPPAPFLQDF